MASCWCEMSGDEGMHNVRKSQLDPHHPPPGPDTAKTVRSGRGIVQSCWSIASSEFIHEKGGYAGQKFRVVVE